MKKLLAWIAAIAAAILLIPTVQYTVEYFQPYKAPRWIPMGRSDKKHG